MSEVGPIGGFLLKESHDLALSRHLSPHSMA